MVSGRDAEEIQQQMERLRGTLSTEAEKLARETREFTSWRSYVKSHPWLFLAAAAALGYFLVPRRREILTFDINSLAELSRRDGVMLEAKPEPRSPRFAGTMVQLGARFLLSRAFSELAHQAVRFLDRNSEQVPDDSPSYDEPG